MTPDPKPYNRAPAARTARDSELAKSKWLNRPYLTHDEICARDEQCWRLRYGAEPSLAAPSPLLNYGPYTN